MSPNCTTRKQVETNYDLLHRLITSIIVKDLRLEEKDQDKDLKLEDKDKEL